MEVSKWNANPLSVMQRDYIGWRSQSCGASLRYIRLRLGNLDVWDFVEGVRVDAC